MTLTKITSTNIQPGAIESSSLETSGATAGTYGAAAKIPVLSVNAQGIVYAITEADVAGVTDFTYNSSTEVLTISTADGSTFDADISTLASQTYVDTAESDAVTTANAYTDTRESAITTAYENYTDTAVSNLVDTAPAALDTLNELAAALGDDANFATTVSTNLGNKVDKINITGATVGTSTAIPVITFNAQGQITSASTTPITVGDGTLTVNSGTGLSGSGTFTANQTSNGTITLSHADTSTQSSVNNSGGTVIQDVTVDGFGHVTGLSSTDLTTQFLGINAKAADSDLLDGINSSLFLRNQSNYTSSYSSDADNISGIAFLRMTGGANGAFGTTHHNLLQIPNSSATQYDVQLAITTDANPQFKFRAGYGGSGNAWSPWREIWHDGNDGAGSGLDADTVDGLQASQFLRSDANDQTTNILAIGSASGAINGEKLRVTDTGTFIASFQRTDGTPHLLFKGTGGTSGHTGRFYMDNGAFQLSQGDSTGAQSGNIWLHGTSNGNVGIGTSSPGTKLEVKGASSGPSDGAQIFQVTNSSGGTKLAIGVEENTAVWLRSYESGVGGRSLIINDIGGNVGIGASPAYPLDVRSGVAGDQLFLDSTGNQNAIRFAHNSTVKSQFGMSIASGRIISNSDPYDTNLKVFGGNFRVGDGDGVEKFRVDVDDDYIMIPSTTFANLDTNAPAGSIAYVTDDNGNLAYRTSGGWSIFTAAVGSSANPAESVAQILSAGADTGDGIYYFLLNGATVPIYCDFTYDDPTHGRGWMLAGRVFGNNTTFNILSANWTNTSMFGQKTSYTDTDNMKNEAWLYYNHNVTLFQFKSTMSSSDLPYTRATHNKATTLNGIFDWDNKANGFITFPEQFETSGSVTTALNNYLDATGYTDGRSSGPYGKLGLNVFMQTGTASGGTEENWDTVSAGQSARSGCRFGFLGDNSAGGGVWPGQTGGPDDFFVGISGQHCYDAGDCNVISSTQTPGSYRFSGAYNGDTGSFYTRVNLWVK